MRADAMVSGALRGLWAMAAAISVMSVLAGSAAAASTPAVVSGWPVQAPPGGDVYAVPGGPILVAGGTAFTGTEVAGHASSGRIRWHATVGPTCGNCYGPAIPLLSPTGVLGPIGDFGGGLSAFDRSGVPVPACAGAIADDGDCYRVAIDPTLVPPRLAVERPGRWRLVVDDIPLSDYDLQQPTVAFAGDVVVVHSPTADRILGIRRDTGTLLWNRPAPPGTLGPVAPGDGIVRVAGPGREVSALSPATGEPLWRADLPGAPLRMLAGADRSGIVVMARVGTRRAVVHVDGDGRARTVVSRPTATVDLGAVGPDGTVYLTRSDLSRSGMGEVSAIDMRGDVRWRFAQPLGRSGGVGAPAIVGRDVVVTIGRLMYRLRPSRRAAAPPRRMARLDMAASRFRMAGDVSTCATGSRSSCRPSTPLGTVARLRLSRAAAGSDVRVTLVRVGASGSHPVWSAPVFRGRTGSQWLAISASERSPGAGPAAPAPGRHSLVARGGTGTTRWAVSAPVVVVR